MFETSTRKSAFNKYLVHTEWRHLTQCEVSLLHSPNASPPPSTRGESERERKRSENGVQHSPAASLTPFQSPSIDDDERDAASKQASKVMDGWISPRTRKKDAMRRKKKEEGDLLRSGMMMGPLAFGFAFTTLILFQLV